jgi:hypothetical protein
MQADQIAAYFPFVELMNQVETTKVLWILSALLTLALVRIYFLSARVRKLEGCEPEPSATGWIRPTKRIMDEVPARMKRSYPPNALYDIHPWSNDSIASLSLYMRQSVSIGEIALQRRIVTVSAIVHGFAIPAKMMLLDEDTVSLYQDYRSRVSPALGNLELMQLSHASLVEKIDEERIKRLLRNVVPIIGLLMDHAANEAWPVFDIFARPLISRYQMDRHEIKSIVTAYSAYSKMFVPSEYILNNATA